jgi:hypothetical protein
LEFVNARYYSSDLGRFIARDPIGYEGGINLYAYVESAPTFWIDSLGLDGDEPPAVGPKPNDGKLAAGHEYVSVKEEKDAKVYDTKCDIKCKPLSISMTLSGKPKVGKNRGIKNKKKIYMNPWGGNAGEGMANMHVGENFGHGMNMEWVITFNTDPRKCRWGRQIYRDWLIKEGAVNINSAYNNDDDSDSSTEYIIGNQVFMYDRPRGGMFGGIKRIFKVWAIGEGGAPTIEHWSYVDTTSYTGEKRMWEINTPNVFFDKYDESGF